MIKSVKMESSWLKSASRRAGAFLMRTGLNAALLLPLSAWAAPEPDLWKIATPQELPFDEKVVTVGHDGGIDYKEFYYTSETVNGEAYRIYAVYAAPQGKATAPAVLFIHGGGGTADIAMVKTWAGMGYSCLSFDWTSNPGGKTQCGEFSKYGSSETGKKATFLSPPRSSTVHHAQVAARRAISWLQQQPEVKADKIGVLGISWGGFHILLLNGSDDRVKAAVDIYGAGFYRQTGFNDGCFGLTGPLQYEPPANRVTWLDNFDPQHYVPQAKAPLLLVTGTNDIFFLLPLVIKTYAALPVEKRLWLQPNVNHGIKVTEINAAAKNWFDFYLRGEGTLPPVVKLIVTVLPEVTVKVEPSAGVKYAQLNFLWVKFPANAVPVYVYPQKDAIWEKVQATVDASGNWTAKLPTPPSNMSSVSIFVTVETGNGLKSSSEVQTLELPATMKTPLGSAQDKPGGLLELSFESGLPSGNIAGLYVNPVGNPQYDNSGTKAHGGKGAVAMIGEKKYIAISGGCEAGKTYRLSGWFRAEGDAAAARLQINWKRRDGSMIKFDMVTPPLTNEYQLCTLEAKAPEGATSTLLIIGCSDNTVWLDDVYFGDVVDRGK
jgi:dienelactone hydrolase